jgi:hypothetical protein
MYEIDPIFLTTTYIERIKNEDSRGCATGFFFAQNGNEYLVTNKHVIYEEDYYKPDSIPKTDKFRLFLHTDPNILTVNESVEINLFKDGKEIWLEHEDPRIDIVLVPLKLNKDRYVVISTDENLLDFENLVIKFEKIFVMGYPYGWFDRTTNLPITRVGHLSSPFRVLFHEMPVMIGDVETHKGMSGGPVYMELRDYIVREGKKNTRHLGTTKIILIGVHSGQPRWDLIDEKTGSISESVSHSLIFIWFSDLIPDIISQRVKKI